MAVFPPMPEIDQLTVAQRLDSPTWFRRSCERPPADILFLIWDKNAL